MAAKGKIAATLIALAAYFGIILLAEWLPSVRSTGAFFLYVLSLPIALVSLIGLGVWGGIGWLSSRGNRSPASERHRTRSLVSLAGLVLFGSMWAVSAAVRGALPSGSYRLEFVQSIWQDQTSSEFVQGDITPRQKMLGDLLRNVLPGRSREEVEELLGPSLETPYFKDTGRDLIYILGPQRDSFISIDSEWLLIWFDTSGRLERHEIYTD